MKAVVLILALIGVVSVTQLTWNIPGMYSVNYTTFGNAKTVTFELWSACDVPQKYGTCGAWVKAIVSPQDFNVTVGGSKNYQSSVVSDDVQVVAGNVNKQMNTVNGGYGYVVATFDS